MPFETPRYADDADVHSPEYFHAAFRPLRLMPVYYAAPAERYCVLAATLLAMSRAPPCLRRRRMPSRADDAFTAFYAYHQRIHTPPELNARTSALTSPKATLRQYQVRQVNGEQPQRQNQP